MAGAGKRLRRALLAGALQVAFAAAVGFLGCGRKGPPRPPQFVIPESPAPVRVAPVADGLEVTWRRPREYADGTALEDLGGFDVYRSCGEGDAWIPVATLPVSDRERFRKGQSFAFVDRSVHPDAPCRYRVVAATLDGYRSPPAEGAVGEPEPTPTPTPTPLPAAPTPTAPGAADDGRHDDAWPGAASEDLVPAPLASPTPFPAPPW
jgi:Prokaryotic lipoprotein-attachment site